MRLNEIEDNLLETYKDQVSIAITKYKQHVAIYRGSKTYNGDVQYLDPNAKITERTSSNTYNYYNLWMSNNPQWAEFPKRNRSLICSSNSSHASGYGTLRVVIPLTNCKIGICPSEDIWNSFKNIGSLRALVEWLFEMFQKQWPDQDNKNITYQELMQKLKLLKSVDDQSYINDILKNYDNAEDMLKSILDPVTNGFKLTTWQQFNYKRSHSNELWLSAPCLLIYPDTFKQVLNGNIDLTK